MGGLVPDADVVLEIINGITYLTPLWLRTPRVFYVHHVHHDQYVKEMGGPGRLAAFVAETAPLRWLYRGGRFVTVSHATARQLVALGVSEQAIEVNYHGPEPEEYGAGERSPEPTLLYLGRLKKYKRIEVLFDILDAVPEASLDIVGAGEHRSSLEADIVRRGLSARVRLHGFVDHARKVELLQAAWICVTASAAEGWGLTTLEAAACLTESVEHERTGLLAADAAGMAAHVRRLIDDPELRERLGRNALARAESLGWRHTAERTMAVLEEQIEHEARKRVGRRLLVAPVVAEPAEAPAATGGADGP